MKSVILYGIVSAERPPRIGNNHRYQAILVEANNDLHVWVRAQVVYEGVERALHMARPAKGETVLNTIPLP